MSLLTHLFPDSSSDFTFSFLQITCSRCHNSGQDSSSTAFPSIVVPNTQCNTFGNQISFREIDKNALLQKTCQYFFFLYIFYILERFKFSPTSRCQFHHPHHIYLWKNQITGGHYCTGQVLCVQLGSPSSKAMPCALWEHHRPTGRLSMLQNAVNWRRKVVTWAQSCLLGRLLEAGCLEVSCCWGNQGLYLSCLFSTVAKGTGSICSSLCHTRGNFSVFFLL